MRILILDGRAVCYMVYYALPSLTTTTGLHTAIIFGFINQLFYFQQRFDADRIVFAWDSNTSKRTEIFPDYKKSRKEKKKEEYSKLSPEEKKAQVLIRNQFVDIRISVLPKLGFKNIFVQVGYEGDDIIASVCNTYKNDDIIIVGNDRDLFQLITDKHVMYYLKTREIINKNKVMELYKVFPDKLGELKSMAGCKSDEVPGIMGVSDIKAAAYLNGGLKKTSKIYQKIMGSTDIIEFTKKLVVLPFEGTQEFRIQRDDCTIDKFKSIITDYEFKSMQEPGFLLDLRRLFCGKTSAQQFDTNFRPKKACS